MVDLASVMQLEKSAFPKHEQWSEKSWHDELLVGSSLIDENLRAVAAVRTVGDDTELFRIIVDEGARRQGLGKDLLKQAIATVKAAGAERMFLEVGTENEAALALYQSLGFQVINRRKDYYASGTDALIMELRLSSDE